jgi:hypothetical protein
MAHYCECRRHVVLKSAARHARAGWIYRPGHDLCRQCWRSLAQSHAIRSMVLARARRVHIAGYAARDRNPRRQFSSFEVVAHETNNRRACLNLKIVNRRMSLMTPGGGTYDC